MPEASPHEDLQAVEQLKTAYDQIVAEIGKVIIGQREIVDQLLIALLCGGHCLLVGVPGLAKTLLISTLARALDLSFSRIQFTPDLMPSDITGTELLEEDQTTGHKAFRFVKGPLFANIILADEINRTPPKTQAALLQAMQEHEVTAGGGTFRLEEPFFVLATQNHRQEGTYPCPSPIDRFIFNLWIVIPPRRRTRHCKPHRCQTTRQPVSTPNKSANLQQLIRKVHSQINRSSRGRSRSAKPALKIQTIHRHMLRGALARRLPIHLLCQERRLSGRYAPSIDDVSFVAKPVLRHRLVTNFNAEAEGITPVDLIDQLLKE